MNLDLPHAIVTGLIAFAVIFGLEHASFLHGASKRKRALIAGMVMFVVVFVLNVFWPYGNSLVQ